LQDLDRTFATFAEAEKLGVKPDLDTYLMLLEACSKTRQKQVAERVWKELEASGLKPNEETYAKYLDVLVFSGGDERGKGPSFSSSSLCVHNLVWCRLAKEIFLIVSGKKMSLPEGIYVRLISHL